MTPPDIEATRALIRSVIEGAISFAPSQVSKASPAAEAAEEVVAACARLDQNDTDNGARLLRHFGRDILYGRDIGWHVFVGTHYDLMGGSEAVVRFAQETAKRIKLEALRLKPSPDEEEAIAAGRRLKGKAEADLSEDERAEVQRAKTAANAVSRRRSDRHKFAIFSGNAQRINAMISQALPHRSVPPEDLDRDRLHFNVLNGTLRFSKVEDLECPDPDVRRWTLRVELLPHDRAHQITKLAPVRYDPEATCPRFEAFLARFQPDLDVRRFIQIYHGYSMTGLTDEQVLVFNHGAGANGKSTFIEAICRLMGPYAEILNSESLTGQGQRRGDQATPDFARLPGARLVRISELPRGELLKEALVKALTGGEPMLARHLHKGFFKFDPVFKAVMSGNDLPQIGGVDHGIWRRMRLIPWPATIPSEEQRPMGEILAEFEQERSGILNWLTEGLRLYFERGLVAPAKVCDATAAYREEMDPLAGFIGDCIEAKPGHSESARTVFDSFTSWCMANAVRSWSETRFGKAMPLKSFVKTNGRVRHYLDIRLHDVPNRPEPDPRSPS